MKVIIPFRKETTKIRTSNRTVDYLTYCDMEVRRINKSDNLFEKKGPSKIVYKNTMCGVVIEE